MNTYYILILVATAVQFIVGALWYSPLLFGNIWMRIHGTHHLSSEEIKDLQKKMTPFYFLQLVLTIICTSALALFLQYVKIADGGLSPYCIAAMIWFGFIVPTQIATVIWGSTRREVWTRQIAILSGGQLVNIMLATLILSL